MALRNLALKLAFFAFLFFIIHLYGCGERKAKAEYTAPCSNSYLANGTWFQQCQLFGRTCIVSEKNRYDGAAIWCAQ